MKFEKEVVKGKFIDRPNRFQALVEVNDEVIMVHVPNTGRLKEILKPEVDVLLRVEDNPNRKTKYSLIGAYKGDILINFDSQMPNKVVKEALEAKLIDELKEYQVIEPEKKYGNSRFDFRLRKNIDSFNKEDVYFLEVKGVTLENDKVVSFPDAKTLRGARHLDELTAAKKEGYGAGVIFVVQLKGAKYFTPNKNMDEGFTTSLKSAFLNGVDIFCYDCIVEMDSLKLDEIIKVDLGD